MVKNIVELVIPQEIIMNKIYFIRGHKVMLDRDLAELYNVETRRLNEQVKRNIKRFPEDFMFQLTEQEFENLMSQFATSSWGGLRQPDEKTVWLFRENITNTGLVEDLFMEFKNHLASTGLIFNEGQLVDASFTIAPRQRNTREENEKIKNGQGDDLWNNHPHKKRHKDIDARWTKKNNETFYGYKNHAKVDTKSKFVNTYVVTDASVHDSQALEKLLDKKDEGQTLHADSAYTGEEQEKTIEKYMMKNKVHEKGYRNAPLTEEQKTTNKEKSKTRARVEHVFGFMEQSMNGLFIRSVGIVRATGIIGLINLTYNIFRYEQVIRPKANKINQ